LDDKGSVYVTDMYNHRVQVFSVSGELLYMWVGSVLASTGAVTVDRMGNFYMIDIVNAEVQAFSIERRQS